MVTPDEEQDQFVKDPRTACKYGTKCYQRNPLHQQKYKHPPKKRPNTDHQENTLKRPKVEPNQDKGLVPHKENADELCELDDAESIREEGSSDVSDTESKTTSTQVCVSETDIKECLLQLQASTSTDTEIKEDMFDENSLMEDNIEKNALHTQEDIEQFILNKFLVKMPPDFYQFWDYCATLKPSHPNEAFTDIDLLLVGPYDVCAGKFSKHISRRPEDYLTHWRYFHDPPEFQTILKGSNLTGYHIGYFRDDPYELPVFVGGNHALKNGEISIMGDNIFAAVIKHMEATLKISNPFKQMSIKKALSHIKEKAASLNLNLSENSENILKRKKHVLTSTFNKAGLVVPYNKKTQLGYRHLYISNKDLCKLLDRVATASEQKRADVLSKLQEVLTAASIATDECDFGTGLELGLNILAHGVDSLNGTIEQYLTTAYNLLERNGFAKIASAHMANRRKGHVLSIL